MSSVAQALRQHADAYLAEFSNRMPIEHRRVLGLITRCRTGELGHLRYQCESCPNGHWVGRSCGNRHCPNCQNDKTQLWLEKRMAQLLPVPYFLVTFTVPEALRMFVRAHQRDCYQALFDTGSQTIRELASGKRFIGTDRIGFFGALHTWGRDHAVYHPHVHFVVPGGGVSADGSKWQACPANFLLPEKAASIVYKAKFRDAMREAGLLEEINAVAPDVWKQNWVVDVQPVGDGRAALKYLALPARRDPSRRDQRQAHRVGHRLARDLPIYSNRRETISHPQGIWDRVRTKLPATHIAAEVSQTTLLRIRQFELQVEIRLGSDAGLVLPGLVLADETATTRQGPHQTTRSLRRVRQQPGSLNNAFELRLTEIHFNNQTTISINPDSIRKSPLPRSQTLICYPTIGD